MLLWMVPENGKPCCCELGSYCLLCCYVCNFNPTMHVYVQQDQIFLLASTIVLCAEVNLIIIHAFSSIWLIAYLLYMKIYVLVVTPIPFWFLLTESRPPLNDYCMRLQISLTDKRIVEKLAILSTILYLETSSRISSIIVCLLHILNLTTHHNL